MAETREKKRLALLSGGYSPEGDVAMISGQHVARIFANDDQYQPYLIRVNRQGWFFEDPQSQEKCEVNKRDFSITLPNGEHVRFDLAMLLIGGAPGEDGEMQGYLELMNIPYVGCGILASGKFVLIANDSSASVLPSSSGDVQ